ncbi:putative Zn(2)-C6 fungal-type domain-containing protein [Seiridium cardinale]|uniref:Zn(2)-C6 fungal-type domain-containing protein n=1 Tax=Seiridium cardinale TaxID=138064 RepID=A0ABR2Y7R9_9PEZI
MTVAGIWEAPAAMNTKTLTRPTVNGLSPVSDAPSMEQSPHARERSDMAFGPEHLGHGDGQAHRACEKCRASKRKCDKTLPYCTRCTRLNAKCVYLAESVGSNQGANGNPVVIFQPRVSPNDVLLKSPHPLQEITPSQILSLISKDAPAGETLDWTDGVRGYYDYIHSWYAVVHRGVFEQQIAAASNSAESPPTPVTQLYSPPLTSSSPSEKSVSAPTNQALTLPGSVPEPQVSRELALLIVTMYLSTRHRFTASGERAMYGELYQFVKRIVAIALLENPLPKIELVQCGALLAMYEYGHGDSLLAYRTLSESVAAARVLGIKPGRLEDEDDTMSKGAAGMEEQQNSCVWWSLFILDQFLHRDRVAENLPFILESPEVNTLLPAATSSQSTPIQSGRFDVKYLCEQSAPRRQRLPISVEVDTRILEQFQLSAKISCLLHRALRHEHYIRTRPGYLPPVTSFSSLDGEIRAATAALLQDDVSNWQVTLDCFAMAVSALFSLYLPYLPVLETKTGEQIRQDHDLTTALAALRFAAQLSVDISCKANVDMQRTASQPVSALKFVVAPAAPTCYLVVKTYATLRKIFPEEWQNCQDAMQAKYESLRIFAYRWGIAEKMMRQLQELSGLDRNEFLKADPLSPVSVSSSGPMDVCAGPMELCH